MNNNVSFILVSHSDEVNNPPFSGASRVSTSALTSAPEGPSSSVEIQHSPFQPLPPLWLEDSGGHAAQLGVGHVHGGAGASLDHLHPGHHAVQQVNPMAHAQSVSHVALKKNRHRHVSHCMLDWLCSPERDRSDLLRAKQLEETF